MQEEADGPLQHLRVAQQAPGKDLILHIERFLTSHS